MENKIGRKCQHRHIITLEYRNIDLKKKDSAKYKANKNAQGKGGREKEKGHSGDKDG